MIRRPRPVRLSATAGISGSDTDTLQTDVMRFMSIIGLCLMAVFALVQGLPVQEAGKLATQVNRWRAQLQAQQQQLARLQDDLQALRTDNAQLQQALHAAQASTVQATDSAQQHRQQAQRLAAGLAAIEEQLVAARQALEHAERQQRIEQRQQASLEAQLQKTRAQLERSRETLDQLQRAPARPTPETPVEQVEPVTDRPPEPSAGRPGFRLQFASDAALDRLVADGAVSLFALADARAWQARYSGGQLQLTEHALPRWYHEMATATVPAHYLAGFAAQQADHDGPVTWGVQLPAATRQHLQALTRQRQGGTLVIGADGRVELQGDEHD